MKAYEELSFIEKNRSGFPHTEKHIRVGLAKIIIGALIFFLVIWVPTTFWPLRVWVATGGVGIIAWGVIDIIKILILVAEAIYLRLPDNPATKQFKTEG